MLAVAAVTENKVPQTGSGIPIGSALAAGLMLTGGILNPAVAIAMGQAATPALWATLLGGAGFSLAYAVLEKGRPPKVTR